MLIFDVILMAVIVWIAIGSLSQRGLYKAVVMFVVFGLFMALAWIRLGAPDVALAEAAIGAGVTGAILLDAVGHLRRRTQQGPQPILARVALPSSRCSQASRCSPYSRCWWWVSLPRRTDSLHS